MALYAGSQKVLVSTNPGYVGYFWGLDNFNSGLRDSAIHLYAVLE
jgi:hypothetical protein